LAFQTTLPAGFDGDQGGGILPGPQGSGTTRKEPDVKGFVDSIEDLADANEAFRRVLYTGRHLQLVMMRLLPGEEIGLETHLEHDQFFQFIDGKGAVIINGLRTPVADDSAVLVPAGARHNIVNTGEGPLKFYSLYGPPEHRDGLVHDTYADAARSPEPFDGRLSE
jgi:mannose-6-phosphate isomerase-like protein (cupin superfamily)